MLIVLKPLNKKLKKLKNKNCFNPTKPFEHNSKKFFKTFNKILHKSFKKVRIGGKCSKEESVNLRLMEQKRTLKESYYNSKCSLAKSIISSIICKIENELSHRMYVKNTEQIKEFSDSVTKNGIFSQSALWKVKKKLCPTSCNPPMAKRDEVGNLITSENNLKILYLDTYIHRLRHRKMCDDYVDIMMMKDSLWTMRLQNLQKRKSLPWSMSDLENVLSSLKTNQARDPLGLISEIFKPNKLECALRELINGIKANMYIPENL